MSIHIPRLCYGSSWSGSWNTNILKNHWSFSALYVETTVNWKITLSKTIEVGQVECGKNMIFDIHYSVVKPSISKHRRGICRIPCLCFQPTYMFLWLTCRVKQMLSNATREKQISWVFNELSSTISKISYSVSERHENRSFFENKRLFFKKRYMFLMLSSRVKRMLSNSTSLKPIYWVFKELSSIIPKISCSGRSDFQWKINRFVSNENF